VTKKLRVLVRIRMQEVWVLALVAQQRWFCFAARVGSCRLVRRDATNGSYLRNSYLH